MLAGNPSCFDQMYTLFKLYIKSDVMPLVEKKLLEFGGKKMRVTKRDRASTLGSGVQSCTGEESIFFKKKEESKQLIRSVILNSHAMGPR